MQFCGLIFLDFSGIFQAFFMESRSITIMRDYFRYIDILLSCTFIERFWKLISFYAFYNFFYLFIFYAVDVSYLFVSVVSL